MSKVVEVHASGGPRKHVKRELPLEIRAAKVDLDPRNDRPGRRTLPTLAILARKCDPPKDCEELHSVLLCSEGDAVHETVTKILEWNSAGCAIAGCFAAQKVGNRIEGRGLDTPTVRGKRLAFAAITACRFMDRRRLCRETPDAQALEVFAPTEIRILYDCLRPAKT